MKVPAPVEVDVFEDIPDMDEILQVPDAAPVVAVDVQNDIPELTEPEPTAEIKEPSEDNQVDKIEALPEAFD